MQIDIHDVGHGACAVITAYNGKRFMIDCGHNDDPLWRPSMAYRGVPIEELVVSNYDEDHVSDLVNVMAYVPIRFITTNTSVRAADLGLLKLENGAGPGIARLHQWMQSVEGRAGSGSPDYGGEFALRHYWNAYPTFEDENNISVATVADCAGFKVLFLGDLETAGCEALLSNGAFARELQGVHILVAPHHGRASGQCDALMRMAEPQLVVMSDHDKQFDSQETVPWYAYRAKGTYDASGQLRHVYTTRRDGHIRIWQDSSNAWSWRVDSV